MAGEGIIESLNHTIENLITNWWEADPPLFTGSVPNIDFSFNDPRKEWVSKLDIPTINIYLYKLTENLGLRNNEWKRVIDQDNRIKREKPKPRINCSYIITAWTKADESTLPDIMTEHRILSEIMAILTSFPVIPREVLHQGLWSQDPDLPTAALLTDDVKSPGEFWNALQNRLAPFIHYVVTLSVDPKEIETDFNPAPMVTSIDMRTGITQNWQKTRSVGYYTIGGRVYSQSPSQGVPHVMVRIDELDMWINTDEQGYFIFRKIPQGKFTFNVLDLSKSPEILGSKIYNVPPKLDVSPIEDIDAYNIEI